MVYDEVAARLLLFGGANEVGELGDSWEYDGVSWVQQAPLVSPWATTDNMIACAAGSSRVVLQGGGDRTWERVHLTAHARHAAHALVFPLDGPSSPSLLTATYVGAGQGDDGSGAAAEGLELLTWDPGQQVWSTLGAHAAADGDPAAARTITAELPAWPRGMFGPDAALLLAVPTHPSSQPPGVITSQVRTDYVELTATYVIP